MQGFTIALAVDNDPVAVETYNKNLNPVAVCLDVKKPEFFDALRALKKTDVVIGGFPCQGFSKAGPKNEMDDRNFLYLAMVDAVEILAPKVFVAENVDGITQNFGGSFSEKIVSDFKKLGYTVHTRLLDAVGFGAPQHRRRLFFVGTQEGYKWNWGDYTHNFETRNGERNYDLPLLDFGKTRNKNTVSIGEVIDDLENLNVEIKDHQISTFSKKDQKIMERIGPGKKLCNVRFSETSVYTWEIPDVYGKVTNREKVILELIGKNRRKKRFGTIPNGNPLSRDVIEDLLGDFVSEEELLVLVGKDYLKIKDGKYDLKGAMFCSGLYKRPVWTEPSPTVLTNFDNPRYFIHPRQNRPFSVRECARLQTFPDSFEFCGSVKDKYRLIGNAVAPIVARHIAGQIIQMFSLKESKITDTA